MSEELKPCPFCGENAELRGGEGVASWIICNNKKCRATQGLELSGENAVKMWNRRPAEDALEKEVERLKAEVKRMKIGLRKLWYEFRDRRHRPYINHIEYQFYFAVEGKLEALLADNTNNDNKESEGEDE